MSRHEGVSCDSCLKGNFRGRRYKCLVCYDYDLCGACYDAGATTTRHTTEHPMQCILTRNDLELYYGGEGLEQQQSFTCPFCGKMGFTETALHDHVTADHTVSTFEVVCPICAAQPGGDPNLITDDFASHLSLEHRSGPRDLISFLDEPSGSRHPVRRIPHPTRGVSGSRNRNRSNIHFGSSGNSSSTPMNNSRDSVDPIAELLSQLSGVRRNTGSSNSMSQLANIQMQLQLERQQVRAARQQLERLPRRQTQSSSSGANQSASGSTSNNNTNAQATSSNEPATSGTGSNQSSKFQNDFLLSLVFADMDRPKTEEEKLKLKQDTRKVRKFFTQFLLSSISQGVTMGPNHRITKALYPERNLGVDMIADEVTNLSIGETDSDTSVDAHSAASDIVRPGAEEVLSRYPSSVRSVSNTTNSSTVTFHSNQIRVSQRTTSLPPPLYNSNETKTPSSAVNKTLNSASSKNASSTPVPSSNQNSKMNGFAPVVTAAQLTSGDSNEFDSSVERSINNLTDFNTALSLDSLRPFVIPDTDAIRQVVARNRHQSSTPNVSRKKSSDLKSLSNLKLNQPSAELPE